MAQFDPEYWRSQQAADFVGELEALCRKHGIQIAVSGYDSIQLWAIKDGEDPVYATCIEDMTRLERAKKD
jgi:hypothetical protein